jgi:CubicO group peptidase (beta-lactamase class C family)
MIKSWQKVVALLIAVFTPLIGFQAQVAPKVETSTESLVGIWASETRFGNGLSGDLTVSRKRSVWKASLSNAVSTSELRGNSIRFTFPGGGEFRATLTKLTKDPDAINGFWLQPAGVADASGLSDPGGSGQSFASPLALRRVRANTWKGTVRPLERRFTLYLKIARNTDGRLVGVFRNPEANSIGGASQYSIVREGDSVVFTAGSDPLKPSVRFTAALLNSPERLRILWSDIGGRIDLTRREPSAAANFFPRPRGEPKYVYRKPPVTGDGWETAGARDVGMDEAMLERMVQKLIDADPAARRPGLIHSLLVAHRGKLVLEEYFFGFDREQQHDTRSAGKTFASVMLGAAMRGGSNIAPETRIYDLLAGMSPFANPDPRKSQITLAHLMTHTPGLACDDNDDASPGQEDKMQAQRQQPNWWKYTLDLPMAHDPGKRYAYCSANINLVGAALTTATRTWLPEFFDRTIARPLQFGHYYWNLMPTGEGYLGGGAYLRPRDLLKVGQTYLDGGMWKGRRLVDSSWVTRSTAPYVHISPATTGLSTQDFPEFYGEGDDGYAWHLSQLRVGGRLYHGYAATGNGGQILIVIPELELTVVFTGGNYRQGGIWGRWPQEILGGVIIPAIGRR